MTRYHVCYDYSLEEMKPEETIDESKYATEKLHGGILYIHKEYEEEHYFIHKNPKLNGKRIF